MTVGQWSRRGCPMWERWFCNLFRERVSADCGAGRDLAAADVSEPVQPEQRAGEPESVLTRASTEREMDLLRLLALAWDTELIGAELGVTDRTVRNDLTNLRAKQGAKSRFEAVMAAMRLGVLMLGATVGLNACAGYRPRVGSVSVLPLVGSWFGLVTVRAHGSIADGALCTGRDEIERWNEWQFGLFEVEAT